MFATPVQTPCRDSVIELLAVLTAVGLLTTLTVLPGVFALVMGRAPTRSASLDPDDPESVHCDARPA